MPASTQHPRAAFQAALPELWPLSRFGAATAWAARLVALATPSDPPDRRAQGSLVSAIAGIVAVAAERARITGDLPALRDAIDRALGGSDISADPREQGQPFLPPIADASAGEAAALTALMGGTSGSVHSSLA
jgi:hypothetical protein